MRENTRNLAGAFDDFISKIFDITRQIFDTALILLSFVSAVFAAILGIVLAPSILYAAIAPHPTEQENTAEPIVDTTICKIARVTGSQKLFLIQVGC